ncbi:MAG: transcriptional regulator [Planctomycetaceae bacterium]|nr:transcriptional regulator [Planctomycetaceae bacterium]
MALQSRLPEAVLEELPRELLDLSDAIAALPAESRAGVESAYANVVDAVRRRRRLLSLVQEALAQLRLDVKYLMFDLDVTRRERDELRQQMDDVGDPNDN